MPQLPVRKLGDGRESTKVRSVFADGEQEHFVQTAVCSVFEVGLRCSIVLLSDMQQDDSVTPTQIHSSSYPLWLCFITGILHIVLSATQYDLVVYHLCLYLNMIVCLMAVIFDFLFCIGI